MIIDCISKLRQPPCTILNSIIMIKIFHEAILKYILKGKGLKVKL